MVRFRVEGVTTVGSKKTGFLRRPRGRERARPKLGLSLGSLQSHRPKTELSRVKQWTA
jgi:hypothetical protein